MKNKKFIKIFDLVTGIGMFIGGLLTIFTAIFLKGDGKLMLLSAIILCSASSFRTLINEENRPHNKDLEVLLNDERNIQINRIAESKALNFFSKLSSFTVTISMIVIYFFHNKDMLAPLSFDSSFWLGCIISLSVSSLALLIIKGHYINKYSQKM